jgi:hypothetical protein
MAFTEGRASFVAALRMLLHSTVASHAAADAAAAVHLLMLSLQASTLAIALL